MSVLAFLQQLKDAAPVGSIIQAAAPPSSKWLPYDGGTYPRASYPDLGDKLPVGPMTYTARTGLPDTPGTLGATNGTLFVAGAGGTTSAITSPDGVTWTSRVVGAFQNGGSGDNAGALVYAGTRFVMASGSTSGIVAQPAVSADGITWTTTTGASTTIPYCGLAYSSTLGRVVLVSGSISNVYTLDNGATAWVLRACTTAGGARKGVLWTGQKFFSVQTSGSVASVSSDGITWSDMSITFPIAVVPNGGAATDGNGTIVLSTATPGLFHVSSDHGVTWRSVFAPFVANSASTVVTYMNGRFFAACDVYVYTSVDGYNWSVDRHPAASAAGHFTCYKGGVYIVKSGAATSVYTATEDTSRFRVPVTLRDVAANMLPGQLFIKGVR